MAEDTPTSNEPDDTEQPEADTDAASSAETAPDEVGPDSDRAAVSVRSTDGQGTGDSPEFSHPGEEEDPLSRRELNQQLLGRLTLHYPSRDVTVYLDGDAALRVMRAHQRRDHRGLDDLLRPMTSTAAAGWLVLDVEEPLAMSWLPGLPTRRERMAIDPLSTEELSAA